MTAFADENAGGPVGSEAPLSPGWTPVKPMSSAKRRATASRWADEPFVLGDASNLTASAARQVKSGKKEGPPVSHENRFDLLRGRLSASELDVRSDEEEEEDVGEIAAEVMHTFDRDASVLETLGSGDIERNLSTLNIDAVDVDDDGWLVEASGESGDGDDEADDSDASNEAVSGDNGAYDDDDAEGVMSPAAADGEAVGLVFSPRARDARRSLGQMSFTKMLPQEIAPPGLDADDKEEEEEGLDADDKEEEDGDVQGADDGEYVMVDRDAGWTPPPASAKAVIECVASTPLAVPAGPAGVQVSEDGLPYAAAKKQGGKAVAAPAPAATDEKPASAFSRMKEMITTFMTPKKGKEVADIAIETPKTAGRPFVRSTIVTRAVSKHDLAKIACMSPFVCLKKSLNQVDSVASILSDDADLEEDGDACSSSRAGK